MKTKWFLAYTLLTAVFVLLMASGSAFATGIDGGYVGTDACINCHKPAGQGGTASDKTSFKQAGHPYKLRSTKGMTPVLSGGDNVTTITDPLSAILPMPLGLWINNLTLGDGCYDAGTNPTSHIDCDSGLLSWSSVQYVVGGFHRKARWGLKDNHGSCTDPTAAAGSCKTGYVIVGADATGGNSNGTQYNFWNAVPGDPVEDWSDYNNNTDKGYDCAVCHNTNGISYSNQYCSSAGTLGDRAQPWNNMGWTSVNPATLTNKGGWKTEWTFDGVQCEACHGPGSNGGSNGHADGIGGMSVLAIDSSTSAALITSSVAASPYALSGKIEICAKCHMRGTNTFGGKEWGCGNNNATLLNGAEMAGGSGTNAYWSKHHEQYNEMVGVNTADTNPAHGDGAHASLNCTSCHDPHNRASKVTDGVANALGITDNHLTAQQRGVVDSCESCHGAKTLRWAMPGVTCVDCHMGEAVKSAANNGQTGTWGKKSDVKSHIFKISTTATDIIRSANTITDINGALIPVPVLKNALTVDYACGKCHDATLGANGTTVGLASGVSTSFATRADAQFFATNMHNSIPDSTPNFVSSADAVTSYLVNFNASSTVCPSGSTCTYAWDFGDLATGTGVTTSHLYTMPTATSTFLAKLSVTVDGSATNSITKTVYPTIVNHAPVAVNDLPGSTSALPITVTNSTNNVTFTDASTDADGNITTVTVNWGDGNVSTGTQGTVFTHNYTRAAKFSILHTVRDASGLSNVKRSYVRIVPPKYVISGTILTAGGTPVSGASVSLKLNGRTRTTAYTNAGGAYTLVAQPAGTYTLRIYKAGFTFSDPGTITLAGDQTIDITATPVP